MSQPSSDVNSGPKRKFRNGRSTLDSGPRDGKIGHMIFEGFEPNRSIPQLKFHLFDRTRSGTFLTNFIFTLRDCMLGNSIFDLNISKILDR